MHVIEVMDVTEKIATSDRRSSYRLPLPPGAAVMDLPGSSRVPLVDLSADGGRLALPDLVRLPESRYRGVLHLDGHESLALELELVRRHSGASDPAAFGARFTGLSSRASHELSRFLIHGVTRRQRSLTRLAAAPSPLLRVRRPAHIHDLLRLHGLRREQTLSVYEGDDPLPPRLRVRAVDAAAGHLAVTWDGEPLLERGRNYRFLLPAAGAALLFEATVREGRDGSATISFPSELLQGGFRDSLRLPTLDGDGACVSFVSHRGGGRWTTRRSQDVSQSGLSFPFYAGQDLLFPGDRLSGVEIELRTGTVRADAVVRTIAPRGGDGGVSCGIELTDFASAADQERWWRYVFAKAWPRTFDRHPELALLAWRVLDSSEYLRLWTKPQERERLERQFLFTWERPALVPGHLIVLREESRTVGTFATSQVYPSTWLLHSLGVDRDERRKRRYFLEAARELYAAMLSLLKAAEVRHFVLFVQKDKRWTDLLYGGFVEALPPGAPSVYDEYTLYKCRAHSAEPPEPVLPGGFWVEPADARTLRAVAKRLGKCLTSLERDAYVYHEDGIDLCAFAGQGPLRFRREVFVARDERGERAALVAESGSDGVNVFGLLNNCRIFAFSPFEDEAEEKAVCSALLAGAREFYTRRDVDEYIVFATTEAMAAAADAGGGQLVSTGVRWLASCDLLPAWINYVDEVLQVRTLDARGEG